MLPGSFLSSNNTHGAVVTNDRDWNTSLYSTFLGTGSNSVLLLFADYCYSTLSRG